MALFLYAFCPSFDQTRKLISMIVYMDDEIDLKNNDDENKKLKNVIQRYSFIFQRGNIFDLCDWFPFLSEYNIAFDVKTENILIERAIEVNDPIIWANLLIYSKYYKSFFNHIKSKVNEIIETQISRISCKEDIMLHKEFWYILIFHNCPYVSGALRSKMSDIIDIILNSVIMNPNPKPSSVAIKLVCEFLQCKSSTGHKSEENFFNWKYIRGISEQITYRTYQRTIFKRYRGNKYGLYTSLD